MLFPLRAALVIGAIFYFSPVRQPFSLGPIHEPETTAAAAAAAALPPPLRAEAARLGLEALAGSAGGLLRAGFDGAAREDRATPPSRDTLHDADRGAPWHGAPLPPHRAPER